MITGNLKEGINNSDTISIKMSEKLNSLKLLKDINTKYCYVGVDDSSGWEEEAILKDIIPEDFYEWGSTLNTLTLDELIEFIGKGIAQMRLIYPNDGKWNLQVVLNGPTFSGTLIDCFEQFLNYLLDNNLINK